MSTPVTMNGVVYPIPVQGDTGWGPPLTRYLVALPSGMLQKTGGAFTLTADVNFGPSFGLLSQYFTTRTASPATAGVLRLARPDLIEWKNQAGLGNNTLGVDSSDNLVYNGSTIPAGLGTLADGKIWIGSVANLPVAQTLTGDVTTTNAGVTSITAGAIVNADVNNSAAIAYSKLNLTGSIVNTDIFSGAAIDYSKLNLSNAIVNTDVAAAAAIAFSKLASLTSTNILVGSAGNVPTAVAVSGDATLANTGALTLATVNSNVGSFTSANITVNAKGLITAAANGTAGSGTVNSGTANQLAYYATTGAAVSGNSLFNIDGTGFVTLVQSTGAGTVGIEIANTSNSADSRAAFQAQVAGASAEDAVYLANVSGSTFWAFGLDNSVSDQFAIANSATLGTDNALTISTAEVVTIPVQGIIHGTSTNDSAAAGFVGEFISATVSRASPVTAFGTGVYGDVTSISLSAGDWDVTVQLGIINGTISTFYEVATSQTAGNSTTGLTYGDNELQIAASNATDESIVIAVFRVSNSGTATQYLKATAGYTGTAPKFYGRISARRVR